MNENSDTNIFNNKIFSATNVETKNETKKIIKVIEVHRSVVNLATASLEELAIFISSTLLIPQLANLSSSINAFLDIAVVLQGPLAQYFTHTDQTLDAILIRELLSNPSIRPIILSRGFAAISDNENKIYTNAVYTRASTRVRAINIDGEDIAIAAEEPVLIIGFAIDPIAGGSIITSNIGNRVNLGYDTYVESGAFSTAIISAVGPIHPPEFVSGKSLEPNMAELELNLRERGFELSTDARSLTNQTRAAIHFYFSGASAVTMLASIDAAVRGLSGASPMLLKIIGPKSNILLTRNFVEKKHSPEYYSRPWRSVDMTSRLRYLMERLSHSELIVATNPDSWVYGISPLNDLFRVGALGIYLFALTEGRDSERLDLFLENASARNAKALQLSKIAKMSEISIAKARLYMIIIEDKFGTVRSNAIIARSKQTDDPNVIISVLSKQEKIVIETEYINLVELWKSSAKNKCPHVRIVYKLRHALNVEDAIKSLNDLKKYFKPIPSKSANIEWINCISCGFHALCPHVQDRIQMESLRVPYDELRTRLLKYAIRVNIYGTTNDMYTYYCRICSERIAEIIESDLTAEIMGRFGNLDAKLRTKIWTVALDAVQYIRFPTPTDEKQFANVVASVIYPLLMAAEEAILDSKKGRRRKIPITDEEDAIDPRTQLYIILFVYAYILDLIYTSQGLKMDEIGFIDVRNGSKASIYAEKMLRLIIEKHRNLIEQIEDVSSEFIKEKFTDSYRTLRGEGGSSLIYASSEEELAFQTTTVDPIYRYAATVARVMGDLPIDKPTTPKGAITEFETILGSSIPNIIKLARESARDPELSQLFLRRTGVEVPPGGRLEFLMKGPRVNLYTKIYEFKNTPLVDESVREFYSMIQLVPNNGIRYWIGASEKKHTKFKYYNNDPLLSAERGAFFEGYRLFAKYTKSIVSQEAYDQYIKEFLIYRRSEDSLRVAKALTSIKPYYDFKHVQDNREPIKVSLSSIYDEDGRRHDWSKNVTYYYRTSYDDAESPEIEIKGGPAGIKYARENDILMPNMPLVDLKCPICGIRASKIYTLNEKLIINSIQITSAIDSFFVFYKSRCPEGDLHNWTATDTTCTKCGLDISILKELNVGQFTNSKITRDYYEKYYNMFEIARTEIRGDLQIIKSPVILDVKVDISWKSDYSLIVLASELVGVNPTLIDAIGCMEGREYSDIVEGIGIPPPVEESSDPRIYVADATVRLFLSDYSVLRHAARFVKLQPETSNFLNSLKIPKHEYPSFIDLPDVSGGYYAMFAAILKERPAIDAYIFAKQSLCRMVLEVAKVTSADILKVLRVAFAKHELLLILHGQKLFAKPGSFNWAIFESNMSDPDMEIEQAGDVGEDVMEDILNAEEREGVSRDPFSGDNIDYDTSEGNPNNESP